MIRTLNFRKDLIEDYLNSMLNPSLHPPVGRESHEASAFYLSLIVPISRFRISISQKKAMDNPPLSISYFLTLIS
ncbi:hypothetical protein FHW89_004266 [Mucilaginibacter sp. SG564]|nr:hypothetical protein [Mucilaginibacter sp. SG564]